MFARDILRIGARIGAACALFSILAWGQPALTTISDVVFKADGVRFNGLAQITWLSFDSASGASIAHQSTTLRIIDGDLFVQLTPTSNATPPAQYLVLYESDGKIQFQETWNVTPSTTPLRVRDVRTSQPLFPISGGGGAGGLTQIQESDVIGLVADLTARAVKGPGFSNSHAAIINDTGGIEGAAGGAADCMRVDGTSGACGGPFSAVTSGTNTAALTIGTGGSLAPTGTGTITPSVGAGLLVNGNAAAVDTSYLNTHHARVDATSTYGAFLQDFTLAGILFPSQAGASPTAANSWYWDSTSLFYKYGDGSATRTVVSTDQTQTLTNKNTSAGPLIGTVASGASALGTNAIGSGACATAVSATATGTLTTDNILADFNADPTAVTGYSPSGNGILTIVKYPTANSVNFKVCNNTASSITPGAITLNWRVVR